ncbi:hypothetical protein HPB52_001664 [Rhipicephalus sanguineus]|uniref:Uncharacterized protein n=1 Tax=Rhipicephalus sanguineus TaxID=34632 RepID=A0A9D4Q3U9_RHISA|nr:hypothetical protein HPB52_001664 [Rhipicephalus sanguineus]
MKKVSIAQKYGIADTTVSAIWKNREKGPPRSSTDPGRYTDTVHDHLLDVPCDLRELSSEIASDTHAAAPSRASLRRASQAHRIPPHSPTTMEETVDEETTNQQDCHSAQGSHSAPKPLSTASVPAQPSATNASAPLDAASASFRTTFEQNDPGRLSPARRALPETTPSSKFITSTAYRCRRLNAVGVISRAYWNETPEQILNDLRYRNPDANIIAARRMGKSASILITFASGPVPQTIKYMCVVHRCTRYKGSPDACTNCRKPGHRYDVCTLPKVDSARDARAWTKATSAPKALLREEEVALLREEVRHLRAAIDYPTQHPCNPSNFINPTLHPSSPSTINTPIFHSPSPKETPPR